MRIVSTAIRALVLSFLMSGISEAGAKSGAINTDLIKRYEMEFESKGDTRSRINAITNNNIKSLSLNREKLITHNKLFSHKLKSSGVTNQKSSGRCWLFAGLNVFSPKVMAQLKMDEFELSQPYLAFWDKLEKANTFLEEIIALRDRPIEDRTLQVILDSPFGDGGWWHYVTDLIEKYGAVPISAMPETKQSVSTGMLNKLSTSKLRGFASELRRMHHDGKNETALRQRKEEMLAEIYQLLVYTYGPPPKEFLFRYEHDEKDSTGSEQDSAKATEQPLQRTEKHTPASFFEDYLRGQIKEYVILVDNPTNEYDHLYQIESSRNMFEKSDLTMLNLPSARLKHYSLKALLDSQAVWFACDVGKESYSDSGIFMIDIYDYNATFGQDFRLTKADRITYQDISPNHAMVFMGVDTTDDGRPVKWLVENSWGTERGDKGLWYMYDSWFDEYVLVVVIDKALLEPEDARKLEQKPIRLPAWDPFFLALRKL